MDLSPLWKELRGRQCLEELIKIYKDASELEKRVILSCFKASRDPRGIPLFIDVLDEEEDVILRCRAAKGLAGWNIRRGVEELVRLMDEPIRLPNRTFSPKSDFRMLNIRKGWGFPDDEKSVFWPPDVAPRPDNIKPPPSVEEIKKWFEENKHRFPEWKPGDPLPEVEE